MSADLLPCPHPACPGLEMRNGQPDGCGHPTITGGCAGPIAERDALRLAFKALAALVHDRTPKDWTLAKIAEMRPPYFGEPITPEQIAALRALEDRS
jgi:hypothetical protein